MTPHDREGLAALYRELSPEDQHRRFFSAYTVPEEQLDEWVHPEAHGACRFVAVVSDEKERIVGEAAYDLLANGDGELAITVAADWRGWLAPYLLDALVDAAAARGVPNLAAVILLENRRMRNLVEARGYATSDHEDYSTVRVLIGTTGRVPEWPGPRDQPRVLAEAPGGRWRGEAAARKAGLHVVVCPGPGRGRRCPLLTEGACPLAEGADVIVSALPSDHPDAWEILDAHRRCHPDVPLVTPKSTARSDELTTMVLEALGGR